MSSRWNPPRFGTTAPFDGVSMQSICVPSAAIEGTWKVPIWGWMALARSQMTWPQKRCPRWASIDTPLLTAVAYTGCVADTAAPRYEPSAILCVNSAPKSVLASQPQKRQSPTRSEGLSERADNHVEITSDRHSPPRYCKCNRRTFCCPSINRLHTINGRRNWC